MEGVEPIPESLVAKFLDQAQGYRLIPDDGPDDFVCVAEDIPSLGATAPRTD